VSILHWIFDTVAGYLAILCMRDFLLREVEIWRRRRHAENEMERIAMKATAELNAIQWDRQQLYTTRDGAVITKCKQWAGGAETAAVSHATDVDDKGKDTP
jgi:CRISPR/Cas system-associated exonuclease Cas4 (RecB family)